MVQVQIREVSKSVASKFKAGTLEEAASWARHLTDASTEKTVAASKEAPAGAPPPEPAAMSPGPIEPVAVAPLPATVKTTVTPGEDTNVPAWLQVSSVQQLVTVAMKLQQLVGASRFVMQAISNSNTTAPAPSASPTHSLLAQARL